MESNYNDTSNELVRRSFTWGFFNWRPKWLRFFNSSKWLLCTISLYFLVLSTVVNGFYSPAIPTIERRFSLSSAQLGIVTGSYDIAALIVMLPVSYFGIRNRPRSLGIGMFLVGIGFIVILMPHLLIGKYNPGLHSKTSNDSLSSLRLCSSDNKNEIKTCDEEPSHSNSVYYALFITGMVICGIGVSPLVAIGIPTIDDSVKSTVSPVYIALYNCSGIVGIGIGSALAFICLRIFVHPGENTSLKPEDSLWVGAWWIGFALGAFLACIVSIALASLPKYYKAYDNLNENEVTSGNFAVVNFKNLHLPAREFGKHLKSLILQYRSFIFISIWVGLEFFVITGSVAFAPKISSIQFRIPISRAALFAGIPILIAGLIGTVTGGLILKKWNITGPNVLKFCLIGSFASAICGLFLFISCDSTKVIGVNISNSGSDTKLEHFNTCNNNCSCRDTDFHPVCGSSKTFLNPCLAGCKIQLSTRMFSNCSCLPANNNSADLGVCEEDCTWKKTIFFICMALFTIMLTLTGSPAAIATLRSVPTHLKTFAVGIQWMLLRILGSIPGPICVGYLIDSTCTKWEKMCDGSRGSCQLYDNRKMSVRVGTCFLVIQLIGTISIVMALWFFKDNEGEKVSKVLYSTPRLTETTH